ncbi:MAG: GCN5-related N-acetyltransferase [Frankiales bacterium]|nr:GCN5-related N-acetyltransferase [Frankiales bacterium]
MRPYEDSDREGLVALVQPVAALGGAVGFLEVPTADEVEQWRLDLHAELLVALDSGRLVACGALRRPANPVTRRMAEITKVMTHPDARGRGAARAVLLALIDSARADGRELLTLECRGNNHAAQRLYASLGFVVTGRRPDAIAVGDDRFDQVLMHCDLRTGTAGLRRFGSRREGLGSA